MNPVTGKRELSLVSEDQEIAMGRDADPQIVATYGLYDDPELAAWVDGIGQRMARLSHRPDLPWTFRVLDSPVINAFALPGGYVYVTRGILAHMNNEAELAVVLGHEIGHVTARHGAQRQTQATLAGLGLGLGGVLVPEVARYSPLLEQSLGLLFLKYGRDDEHQSDELGVQYSLAAGYDPEVGSRFFEVLDRQMQAAGGSLPGWLSTHPDPGDRVQRTRRLSQEAKKTASGPWSVGENELKDQVDGIVFGDDPRQGYVQGSDFLHPGMAFAVTFPEGWRIQNTPAAVLAGDEEGTVQMQLTLEAAAAGTLAQSIERLAATADAQVGSSQALRIGGYEAHEAILSLQSDGDTQQVLVTCIRRNADEGIFRFLGFATSLSTSLPVLRRTAGSFRALTDAAARDVKPLRVRVAAVPQQGDLESAVRALQPIPVDVATLAMLNNLQADSPLQAGHRLKIVRGTPVGTD